MTALSDTLVDTATIVKRNSIKIVRVPEVVMFTLLQPIMFVLLFAYVFGSAIRLPGTDYKSFLIAGVFVQTCIFGSTWTGASLAEDMQKGVIDRFRSLPMSRYAVLLGRTFTDVVINVLSLVVMALTGLVVGWRIESSWYEAAGGFALLLLFAHAVSWIMGWVGLKVSGPEAVNSASFMVIFPLTFIANTFVPLENLPRVLKVVAEWNPVSSMCQAARELFGNELGVKTVSGAFPIQHPVAYTLLWIAAILAAFVPLCVRAYERSALR